jgi:REP element-mobilizing transposase RayT
MPQPPALPDAPQLFHVNFHTYNNRSVFEVPEYLAALDRELAQVLARWKILSLVRQIMPTHVHLLVLTFPDQPLARIVNLVKGATSHAILVAHPELRGDLGDHLWQEGYDWVDVTRHRQCLNVIRYIHENRRRGGLEA